MSVLPHTDQILHAAEIAAAAPLLGALFIVSSPAILFLAMYRLIRGESVDHDGA